MNYVGKENKKGLLRKGMLTASMLLCFTGSAHAATVSYDLVGDMEAPIYWNNGKFTLDKWYPHGSHFQMDINRGDLVLTYDDRGTAHTGDDIATIRGVTTGCVGGAGGSNCNSEFGQRHPVWGVHQGSGEFEWDLTMSHPIDDLTNGPDDFAFGAQDVGTLTLLDPPTGIKNARAIDSFETIDVSLKNDPAQGFAFRLFPDADGDGVYDAEGWFPMTNGVLGASGARGELGLNNSRLNWNLQLIRHDSPTPPPPPDTEVPEPASALLLCSGLFALRRKRLAANN